MDVRDDDDKTVIDWINDYASDPKNFVIIIKKCKDECLNEFVKYLQEIMRKQSSNVQQKYDSQFFIVVNKFQAVS